MLFGLLWKIFQGLAAVQVTAKSLNLGRVLFDFSWYLHTVFPSSSCKVMCASVCFLQLKKVVSPSSLFRSASHASRLVSSTMKHFGFSYASQLLKPILEEELKKFASGDISYEIDPNK